MTDFTALRTAMVDCQIRPSDVTKFPIIQAMLSVPREVFVPSAKREVAYAGGDILLGQNRVVMDPRVLAKMLDALGISLGDLVLEIGCGLGYGTAVIACLAEAVIAVETDEQLAAEAGENLDAQSVDNAIVVQSAMENGAAKHGPYDKIVFSGGVEQVPSAILEQLKEGGHVAAIFMQGVSGQCRVGVKTGGRVAWRNVFDATVPVLPGFEKERQFAL